MAKLEVDKFLDVVTKSRLVEPDQLDEVLAELRADAGDEAAENGERIAAQLLARGLITPWQRDRLLEGRHKGFFLGKHKLLGHLGTGGMSSVYLAEHVLMGRRVAIKVLPQNRINDSSYLARFHREARAAASVDHPNIVRVYDADNDVDIHYLVMEYVEGRDLQAVVKEDGPLRYEMAAEYIRQAACGLEHAHRAGLIHRDIKPGNLLIDVRGAVKILDMGLARFADDSQASLTVAYDENVLGTADYLAPEQAVNSHHVDARADIYSLGCTLYYLLTGHPPFPDGTLPQRLMAHQKKEPTKIHVDRPDAPEDLVAICGRMMAKSPDDRFPAARDVADVLSVWLAARGSVFTPSAGTGESSVKLSGSGGSRAGSSSARGRATGSAPPPGSESYPAAHDTVADVRPDTVKGPGKDKPDSGAGKQRRIPVARSLDDNPFAAIKVAGGSSSGGYPVTRGPTSSGAFKAIGDKGTRHAPPAKRSRNRPPKQVVLVGVAAAVVTLVVVALLIVAMR